MGILLTKIGTFGNSNYQVLELKPHSVIRIYACFYRLLKTERHELLYLGEHQQHEGELNVFTVLGLHKWAEFFYVPYYISSLTNLHSVSAKSWSTLSYTKTSSIFAYKLLSCFFILTLAYKKSKKKTWYNNNNNNNNNINIIRVSFSMEWNGTWHNNEKVKQETPIVFDLRKMWYHNSKRGVKNYYNKFTFSFCINFLRGAFKFRDCQLVVGSLLSTLEHDLVAKGHLIISTSLANSITQNKLREI